MRKNLDIKSFTTKLQANCKLVEVKEFQENEIITTFLVKRNQFCILLEGDAQLITYDKNGNKKILYYYRPNDIFGESLFKISILFIAYTSISPLISFGSKRSRASANLIQVACLFLISFKIGTTSFENAKIVALSGITNGIAFIIFEFTALEIEEVFPNESYLKLFK